MRLSAFSMLTLAAGLLLGTAAVSTALAADAPAVTTGTITGLVVDKDNNPVKGATVSVVPPMVRAGRGGKAAQAAGDAAPAKRPEPVATGTTGDDGKFKIENVPAGKYTVMAKADGKGQGRTKDVVEVKATETVDAGTITLMVRPAAAAK